MFSGSGWDALPKPTSVMEPLAQAVVSSSAGVCEATQYESKTTSSSMAESRWADSSKRLPAEEKPLPESGGQAMQAMQLLL